MKTLRALTCLLLLLMSTNAALAVPVGALVGTVVTEVEDQVAIYRCQAGPMLGLTAGDVVAVMHAGQERGEATVTRTEPHLLISLKGLYRVEPGDLLVYRRQGRQSLPRPSAGRPKPAASPGGPAASTPAPDSGTTPAPEAPTPADRANLQAWHGELDARLDRYIRPHAEDAAMVTHRGRLKKAAEHVRKQAWLEAAALYGKLGSTLQQEGQATLARNEVRGREAWSLGFESLSLRALCLFLAEEPARARAAFDALLQTSPKGAMASARALSMVRGRAKAYLGRLPRPTRRTDSGRPKGLTR